MALLRHSGIYFLARIVAGAAGFAIIAAYTRLLSAQEFGELALALTGVGFFALLILEGPTLAMLRYLPSHPVAARATVLWGLIVPACAICSVAIVAFLLLAPRLWHVQLALSTGLLLATLPHRFQLAIMQGTLKPGQYALLVGLESILDMAIGISLVIAGLGVAGALIGTTVAAMTAMTVNWRGWWVHWKSFDRVLGRQMLRFGLPLALSALFIWLATFGDRWLVAAFIGADKAGLYAAAYDLQMNLLGVPLMVMMLAGYPLTVSAMTERGTEAARTQLRLLGAFVILIVLPEATGIVLTGPLLVNIFLGPEFRPLSLSLLPILVSATFLKVLLIYVNYGYFLGSRTNLTLLSMGTAAAIDILLNLVLIPPYGPWGAAVAAVLGFGAGFAIAVIKMGRVFPFPLPDPAILAGGLIGVAVMVAWLLPFYHITAWSAVFYVVPVAVVLYFGAVFLFLYLNGRNPRELLRSLWSERGPRAPL